MIDPLWAACLDAVKRRCRGSATAEELLWQTAIAFLFASGELSESTISVALH